MPTGYILGELLVLIWIAVGGPSHLGTVKVQSLHLADLELTINGKMQRRPSQVDGGQVEGGLLRWQW